ncbi:RhoGAP-domain-containing protein [Pluteus cervinus]|uniref:RhoGAP-domain-containing protein n=1 Tax=Pluteus cervinus TaxID=181527 RepID=A0ACD3B200_9AGAR|nr:RhoGAP-domain-containing protein [Pluteus cervinus]
MSPSATSPGVNGTPSRDRLPPPSVHLTPAPPQRATAQTPPSAMTSMSLSAGSPSVVANPTITIESLLKAHVASQDPTLAALEQAVGERNTLSAQNAQLWKLIEKQRAAYTQILKDLERVRGERDSYKVKINALAGGHHVAGKDKSNKPMPHDSPSGRISESSASDYGHSLHTRDTPPRHNSDDQATPRTQHHQHLHAARSHDPLMPHDRDTPSSIPPNSHHHHHRPQTPPSMFPVTQPLSTPARSQKPSPAPLTLPGRSGSLPVPASAVSASHESAPFSRALPDETIPNGTPNSHIPQTRPLTYGRKVSLVDSASNGAGIGPIPALHQGVHAGNSIQTFPTPPPKAAHHLPHHGGSTPQTTPPGFGINHSDQSVRPSHSQPHPTIVTSPITPTPAVHHHQNSTHQNASLLSGETRSLHALSRDSRISLPDEARQYIANMGDSPLSSSDQLRPEHALSHPAEANRLTPPTQISDSDSPVRKSEFLDLDSDLAEDDEVETPEMERDEHWERPTQKASSSDSQHSSNTRSHPQARSRSQGAAEESPRPPFNSAQQTSSDVNPSPHTLHSKHASETSLVLPAQGNQVQALRLETNRDPVPASFRALPLLSSDLPYTTITVPHSFIRPNERGKEVLSFVVSVNPGHSKEPWKVEKMYSDVTALDQRVRNSVGKSVSKRIASLPEGKFWKDHAPAKVDQRKAVLEQYLQSLVNLPVKNNDEVVAFFTSDIMREAKQPVMQAGHKEGYLTKRGKNFGGWKTRYFVLSGPILEYYDCRGGTHLGSILITGAQIGRQQRTEKSSADEEKEYRHAFLIVEAKRGPGGNHPRHVLCAESDKERDNWVEMLVRYFTGTYSEDPITYGSSSNTQPRSSTSSNDTARRPSRGLSKDDIRVQTTQAYSEEYSTSPAGTLDSPVDRSYEAGTPRKQGDRVQPSSLPESSPLSSTSMYSSDTILTGQRANSELGHYADHQDTLRQHSPERHRHREPYNDRKQFQPTLNTITSPTVTSPTERAPSPDKLDANGKVKISGPMNGAPIPSGFKFGGKDAPPATDASTSANDRREKAKSRSFWGFGKANMMADKSQNHANFVPRAIFGVALEEALDVAQIANLPAIVFRTIQYLEAKKADQEEGIYRLSGSSAVIKSLKDRFNLEGDIDLLASDEYWDPHAIAGLLKSYLRELPASILTRELHLRFLAVIDFADAQERIRELSQLIAALPVANYSLLRALTAHLILIVQNSSVNKMTMRNVGIVFSPTLGIPAGVFSLMLGEFNRVFNVDDNGEPEDGSEGSESEPEKRNSRQYADAAADQLLGLSGRTLKREVLQTK